MPLNPVDVRFEASLRRVLPPACFQPISQKYLEESRGLAQGQAGLVLSPQTTDQVSQIVKACNDAKVGVVPYGGGTGLVGGQVMPSGPVPVVLSLERMNRVRELNAANNLVICEAGVILANLQQVADQAERLFALSLASEGTCQIGGNLSTNAGGIGVLRYGSIRDLCLGLEAVLPDGTIWNGLKKLRKDNTGFDLKNLLIGAEGSLGIITAASLKLFPKPRNQVSVFLAVRDPQAALDLLAEFQRASDGAVSAFELIDRQGFAFLAEKMPQVRLPFAKPAHWMVLADLGWSGPQDIHASLETLLAKAIEADQVRDALISQNSAQRQAFWNVRESIPEANRLIGAIGSHDISVPVSDIPAFIEKGHQMISQFGDLRINCFGHVGDGNLHYNVYPPKGRDRADYTALRQPIKDAVYGLVTAFGGSISAEHGIGRFKLADLMRYGDPAKLAAMRQIKAALDPNGIMNPGAVVPFLS